MLTNFHTHSTFCDGRNTLEETVLAALDKGFCAIGFSGHGYTDFDTSYCMRDTDGYITQLRQLRSKYKDRIQIYIGVEEDAVSPADRSSFDYIIGSSHYIRLGCRYYPADESRQALQDCIDAFGGNTAALAEAYYANLCDYIRRRKPDIIGHFDLITKFDEASTPFFLGDSTYQAIAERYITAAAQSDCIFEVNTGAIARGLRTTPYPSQALLHTLKKLGAKLILSSDAHSADALDFQFKETKNYLYDIGFRYLYTLWDGKFTAIPIR